MFLYLLLYMMQNILFFTDLGEISSIKAILFGIPLKYQMCATGAASSICPILSLLTFALVTSTPHLSQTTPLYLTLLYLPQWHSQSFLGPNILSQNRPSFSGFKCSIIYSLWLFLPHLLTILLFFSSDVIFF